MTLNELIRALDSLKPGDPTFSHIGHAALRPDRVELEIVAGTQPARYALSECLYVRDTLGCSGATEVYVFGPAGAPLRRLLGVDPNGAVRTEALVGNSVPGDASLEFRRRVFLEMIRSVRPPGGGSTCREYMKEVLSIAKEEGLL